MTNLLQNLTAFQAQQDIWQNRAELSGWQGFREERKREAGCIWKPLWGQGSTKLFLCTAEPVPRHPHLLPVLQTAVTPRGEANRLGAKPPPAEGTCAGQDPRTHLERFQECLLHGQPAILGEKLEGEAKNNRAVSLSACTAGQRAVSHRHSSKGRLLTWGNSTICRAGTETGWLHAFGSHLRGTRSCYRQSLC